MTTIIKFEEQTRGWLVFQGKSRMIQQQVDAYRKLKHHMNIYLKIQVLDFNSEAADEFERLQHIRTRNGTMNLKIAPIALIHGSLSTLRILPKEIGQCQRSITQSHKQICVFRESMA